MTVQEWVDAYAQAWRDRDATAAAGLFTEDCSYRSHPLQEAHLGSEGVRRCAAEAGAASADDRAAAPKPEFHQVASLSRVRGWAR